MRFGLLSDTHGNIDGIDIAVDLLTRELDCKRIFHLGHDYQDIEDFLEKRRARLRGEATEPTLSFSDLAEALTTTLDLPTRTILKAKEGDEYTRLRRMFVRVPGNGDRAYANGHQLHVEFEMLGDRIIALVHNVKELKKEDINTAHIIMYGGSHLYQVDKVGHRWFINPGHLMKTPDKGREPTFGYLDAGVEVPVFRVYGLKGDIKLEKELVLDKKHKFSVTG